MGSVKAGEARGPPAAAVLLEAARDFEVRNVAVGLAGSGQMGLARGLLSDAETRVVDVQPPVR